MRPDISQPLVRGYLPSVFASRYDSLTAAITALGSGSGQLVLDGGLTYEDDVAIDRVGLSIVGQGPLKSDTVGNSILKGNITFPGGSSYFHMQDIYLEGQVVGATTDIPSFLTMTRVVFRNVTPNYDWNIQIEPLNSNYPLTHALFEMCLFDQGGVKIDLANTLTFLRCRFANSRKTAALYVDMPVGINGENSPKVLHCTFEGNYKNAVYLGRNSAGSHIDGCYLEANGIAAGSWADIEVADFSTANCGSVAIEDCVFVGTASSAAQDLDAHIRYVASPTTRPRVIHENNRFNGSLTTIAVKNPPHGLIAIGNTYKLGAYGGTLNGPLIALGDGGTEINLVDGDSRPYLETKDTNLYRYAANIWGTDDGLRMNASDLSIVGAGNGLSLDSKWLTYPASGTYTVRDLTNSRQHMQLTGGANDAAASSVFASKVIAKGGVGVGNSAAASTPGTVVKKMEVFDASGSSLGFIPIYDGIT